MDILGLVIAIVALIVSIWSVILTKSIALTDRKANTYLEAIVYLDSLAFRSDSPNLGFRNAYINDVSDEWVKEQVLVAVNIRSRLELLENGKGELFWDIVSKIYGKEHIFDQDKYQKLRKEIMRELNKGTVILFNKTF